MRTMKDGTFSRRYLPCICSLVMLGMLAGCAHKGTTRQTKRDKTRKGAVIGAVAGAVVGAVTGQREADEILAGAAIGAGIGAGVGAYMDAQEEKLGKIPGTRVERVSEDTLLVHFDSDILFAVDSSMLTADARASLEDVAGVFNEYPKTAVVIQGHTDSTGSESHNQDLSERRAAAVRAYFAGRGVAPERMAAIGYGEGVPQASNDTSDGRRLNRRVNILLKAKAT